MESETIGAAIARLELIARDVSGLRTELDNDVLAVSDRQYVSRCFDLLAMEIDALRQYLGALV